MIYQNDKNQWCRECFNCKLEIIHIGYNSKNNAILSDKLKRKCKNCADIQRSKSLVGKPITKEHKKHISESQCGEKAFWYGKRHAKKTKQKMSDSHKGLRFSFETKQKLSQQKMGKNNPMYGKKPTEIHRERMRVSALKRLKRQGIVIAFNPNACKFIDDYGKENGCDFQHALNGGEVCLSGFPVDGYDKEKNIVFEYDEKHHNYSNKRKQKDLYKQRCIINDIKPKIFIRYNERNNRLYDVLTNKDLPHNNL